MEECDAYMLQSGDFVFATEKIAPTTVLHGEQSVWTLKAVKAGSPSQSAVNEDYIILNADEVVEEQLLQLSKVSQVCAFSNPTWSRTLLLAHRWNEEVLLQKIFDIGADVVMGQCGIDVSAARAVVSGECQCCFDDVDETTSYSLSCGHLFCIQCWTKHIRIKVTEGKSKKIKCMGQRCQLLLDESVVLAYASEEIRKKYNRSLVESYVEDNPKVKWCPSVPHCGHAVRIRSVGVFDVQCKCGHGFCSDCLEDAHSPCACGMVTKWTKLTRGDLCAECGSQAHPGLSCETASAREDTNDWIEKTTKQCPSCKTTIEKNGGCQYMRCMRCTCAFCWICLTQVDHRAHKCVESRTKERLHITAAQSRQFYLSCNDKYVKIASKDSNDLANKVRSHIDQLNVQERRTLHLEIELGLEACEAVRQCSHILRHSYIMTYFLFGSLEEDTKFPNMSVRKEHNRLLVESWQNTIETTIEYICAILSDGVPTDCKRIQYLLRYLDNQTRNMFEDLHSVLLQGVAGIVAPYHAVQPRPYHSNSTERKQDQTQKPTLQPDIAEEIPPAMPAEVLPAEELPPPPTLQATAIMRGAPRPQRWAAHVALQGTMASAQQRRSRRPVSASVLRYRAQMGCDEVPKSPTKEQQKPPKVEQKPPKEHQKPPPKRILREV